MRQYEQMMRIMAHSAPLRLVLACTVVALLIAFSSPRAVAQAGGAAPAVGAGAVVDGQPLLPLGPGDTVSLRVFGQPEMDGTLYVADDGTLNVPLAGPVSVVGLSSADASAKVEKALVAGGYLTNPHVTLVVTQSRSQRVTVLGEVHAPGRYPVDSRTTILDLLAQAGGLNAGAGDLVYVLRPQADGTVSRRVINLREATEVPGATPDRVIQSGESVFVPRAEQFYIYGAVTSPNAYRLEANMTVRQALARAGGLTSRGSDGRIEIQRHDSSGRETTVPAKLDDKIQANDVIKIKESLF
jgi:polysaccharide biosynthesis/export protein